MIKNLYWHKDQDIDCIKQEIKHDNIVISSTDTIYGFLGNITQESFNSICKLKSVFEKRLFLILVSHHDLIRKIDKFADISAVSEKAIKFIENCWPGPVTFIFKAKELDVSVDQNGSSLDCLSAGLGTIAIRCPNHIGLQKLLEDFDGLFSTSANKTGMQPPAKFENIDQNILNLFNYVILDAQESSCDKASTIIDLSCPDYSKDFPFGLVREGDYSFELLQEIYKNL